MNIDFPLFFKALAIFLGGMTASFFFSGTEIGFYRISRIKLILDSLRGCRRSRFLLWLTNHTPIFISTILLGNNLANNFVSLGAVLLFQVLFPNHSVELLSTVIATPIVFIYGELLPKSIFLHAPTRLMKRSAPIFWILIPLFLPLSLLLSFLSMLLARILGEKSRHYSLQMTDTELKHILGEGENVGILQKTQQTIVEEIFRLQSASLAQRSVPLQEFPFIHEKMTREEMIRTARKAHASWILTQNEPRASKKFQPDGFYYFSDLILTSKDDPLTPRSILTLPISTSVSDAFGLMLTHDVPFALLTTSKGVPTGILRRER